MAIFSKKQSKSTAKDRLIKVLIQDRANCSPEILEQMRLDIIQVISKYMEVDELGIDLSISTSKSERTNQVVPTLYANVPIKKMRGQKY